MPAGWPGGKGMREVEQLAQLNRMRRLATGLLVVMALLSVAVRLLQGRYAYLSFVGAFAEAAMVGALADWFAVSALFRHPFGLPIPHTAIIPANKDRIGDSFADFLEHNFMTQEVLVDELAHVDFAGAAARWLAQPQNSSALAHQMLVLVPAMLHLVEDEDAARFMRKAMAGSLGGVKLAPLLAEVLGLLVAGGQHVVLLERMLGMVARALDENRPYIRQKVHENSPRWLPKAIDEKFFERLMDGVQGILDEMLSEEGEWRARFQSASEEFIARLATSPEYEEKLRSLVAGGLRHPLFRSYAGKVWQALRQHLLDSTTAADGAAARRVADALQVFSAALEQDAAVRLRLNQWMRALAVDTIAGRRQMIGAVVKRVIQKWDGATVARKLELQVGKDLQYIRINGTVVGGLVGLLLHALGLIL